MFPFAWNTATEGSNPTVRLGSLHGHARGDGGETHHTPDPKALLAQRRDSKLSSPAHYLPSSDRRLSSAARQSSHKCWSSWSQIWLVWGINQLWITVEAMKLAACTSGTSQCLFELSRCCHKPQNLVLWWKVLCTAVTAVCSKDSVLQQQENPG